VEFLEHMTDSLHIQLKEVTTVPEDTRRVNLTLYTYFRSVTCVAWM